MSDLTQASDGSARELPTVQQALAARMSIEQTAHSSDGIRFSLEAVPGADVRLGSLVVLTTPNGALIGLVDDLGITTQEGPEVVVELAAAVQVRAGTVRSGSMRPRIKVLVASGRVLGELAEGTITAYGGPGFVDVPFRPATQAEAAALASSTARGRGTLRIGQSATSSAPADLIAAGFARHTFMVGQSGSGKTYSTGVLLEQLLARTSLRIVILDPNSDYVNLNKLLEGAEAQSPEDAASLRGSAERVEILTGDKLKLHVDEVDVDLQLRVLDLDPIRDQEEYNALRRVVSMRASEGVTSMDQVTLGAEDEGLQALARRTQNLGIDQWSLWGHENPFSALTRLDDDDWRALVFDLGSLTLPAERDVMAAAVLSRLWSQRLNRRPVLVVIDEAHNVAPDTTEDAVRRLSTELAVVIAGEGRKYGLHLLIASQRPSKVHTNVVSQCDNLVLMRVNSAQDLDDLARTFSHAPAGMVRSSASFAMGQALVAGPISPVPQLVQFGARLTPEGGSDIPTDWARRPA